MFSPSIRTPALQTPLCVSILFALLFSLLFASSTNAQDPTPKRRKPPPVEIVNIDLGWGSGVLSGERWQPATVWITSQDKPFSGILTLTCQQDSTQNATMFVGPVATTPGQITPIEVVFSPSYGARELTFKLTGRSYQTKVSYAREPHGDQAQLPRIGVSQAGQAIFVGETSAKKTLDIKQINTTPTGGYAYASPPKPPSPDQMWDNMFPANIQPGRLPLSWTAYESVDLLVCNAEDLARVDPRIKLALSTWVQSGGRLIVRTDPVGPAWPDFLADVPAPITGTEQQVFAIGDELKALIAPVGATTHQARALTLTTEGERLGWKTQLPVTREGDRHAAGSLLAHGPCGLGMVTIVGFEPRSAATLINDEALKRVWRAIMNPTLTPRAKMGGAAQQYYWGGWEPSETESAGAVNAALDSIATIPPISTSVFWAICACMVVLALFVGPFDAKVLKRRKLSRYSWFTALLWIVIAGAGAVLVPRIMRSGQSVASRFVFADTLCDKEGRPLKTAQLGLTGVFAGKPVTVELEGTRAGAWLRGVSATSGGFGGGDSMISLPDLTIPILSDEQGPGLRTAWPGEIGVPQWSFRTLSDLTPLSPCLSRDIGAKVERADGLYKVTLTNVPQGASIREAWLGVRDEWFPVANTPSETRGSDHVFYCAANPGSRTRDWIRTPVTSPAYWQMPQGSLASLPWVRERGEVVDAMLAGGGYACLCIRLDGLAPDVTVNGIKDLRTSQSTMLRLLTPL